MSTTDSKNIFILASLVQAHYWFVPNFPEMNENIQAQHYKTELGGKGLNVTLAMHKQGLKTTPIISCGLDHTAQQCFKLLQDHNITTSGIVQFSNIASGQGTALIHPDGHNMIAIALGANSAIQPNHVDTYLAQLECCDLVYAQFEISLSVIEYIFKNAHLFGKINMLNPSPWQTPSADIQKYTNWLIVNEIEVLGLLNLTNIGMNEHFDYRHTANIIYSAMLNHLPCWQNLKLLLITLGENGAFMFNIHAIIDGKYSIDIFYVAGISVKCINPTGCGDAFSAAFCAAMSEDFCLEQALEYANCAGAIMAQSQTILEDLPEPTIIQRLFISEQKQTAQYIDAKNFAHKDKSRE